MKRKTILFTIVTLLVSTNVIACDDEEVIVNSSSNSSVSEHSSSTSNSESSSEQAPIHEHTFEETWSYNECSHWHKATCEHTNLSKDLGEHVDSDKDGICDVCKYEDPNFKPEPEPIKNQYFLPSSSIEKYLDRVLTKTEYSYPSDLHGYVETTYFYDDDHLVEPARKDINTYSFSEDFSKLLFSQDEYNDISGVEEYTGNKTYYEFFDNNSYTEKKYEYDIDSKEFVYSYFKGAFNNEHNQRILYFCLYPTSQEGVYDIGSYFETEYDENGFITIEKSYEGKYGEGQILELDSFDVHHYYDDNKYTIESYYLGEDGFYERYSYTKGTYSYLDGIRYDDEQIYYEDGTLGNHNKFGYDSDYQRVYYSYGGLKEEARITKNEDKLITKYEYTSGTFNRVMEASYDEFNNLTSVADTVKRDEEFLGTYESTCSYNDYHQLTRATAEVDDEGNLYTVEISYSQNQDDEMLKHFELFNETIASISDYVFVEGIF